MENDPKNNISVTTNTTTTTSGDQFLFDKSKKIAKKIAKKVAIEAAEKVMRDNLPRYTEILGVFVALFTFVSIQVQVFSKVTSLSQAVTFIFLMFLCMIGFLLTLHLIISLTTLHNQHTLRTIILPIMVLSILIITGFITIYLLSAQNDSLQLQEYPK